MSTRDYWLDADIQAVIDLYDGADPGWAIDRAYSDYLIDKPEHDRLKKRWTHLIDQHVARELHWTRAQLERAQAALR